MLTILGMTYMVNAMDRIVFSILLPNVSKTYGFSLAEGGFLATIFTLGIGLSGIPTGFLMDRLTRMRVLVIGVVIYSAMTILSAFSTGFYDMALYRAISGVGEGMQQAALFTAVGAYFASNRAAALGSMNFAYGIGSFVGPTLAAFLLVWTGDWRTPLLVYGALGLVVIGIAMLTVSPSFTEQTSEMVGAGATETEESIPDRVLNRNVVICAINALALGVAGYGFLGLYPTYLRTELGFSITQAGFAISLFGVGALFGIPAGYVADRVSQRAVAMAATLAMLVVNYLLFNVVKSPVGHDILALFAGAIGSGVIFVNTYSLIQRCVRSSDVGRASGIMVTSLYLPASLGGYLFALLHNQFGWGGAAVLQLCLVPIIAMISMTLFDTRAIRRPRHAKGF
jgi:MFS family permease